MDGTAVTITEEGTGRWGATIHIPYGDSKINYTGYGESPLKAVMRLADGLADEIAEGWASGATTPWDEDEMEDDELRAYRGDV